jgi:hypothetical protein
MYCQVCGTESTLGFQYCKRCGTSLTSAANTSDSMAQRDRKLLVMIWAVVAALMVIGAGGLGITFGIAGGLAGSGIKPNDGPLAIVICGSLTILVTLCLLVRQLSRLIGTAIEKPRALTTTSPLRPIDEAADARPLQISAPPMVVPSVTEHTTRNFERRPDLERPSRT